MISEDDIQGALDLKEKLGPLIQGEDDYENIEKLVPPLRDCVREYHDHTWIKHPWVNMMMPFVNQANEIFSIKFSEMRRLLSERQLSTYLHIIVERPWRYSTLQTWWAHDNITLDELRELLPGIWIDTEYPSTNFGAPLDLWIDAGFITDDQEAWDALPETFPIYRGGENDGIAWTTDKKIGVFFANRFQIPGEEPLLWEATVDKAQVFGHLTDRGESEVIVDPSDLDLTYVLPRDR